MYSLASLATMSERPTKLRSIEMNIRELAGHQLSTRHQGYGRPRTRCCADGEISTSLSQCQVYASFGYGYEQEAESTRDATPCSRS